MASTLVAGLELARDGEALIGQATVFGAILLWAAAANISTEPSQAAQD